MGKLAWVVVVTTFSSGVVACLVPSFDGMSGATDEAAPSQRAPSGTSGKPSTTTGAPGSGDAQTSGKGGSDSGADSAADGGPRDFLCDPHSEMTCALKTQDCCFRMFGGPSWTCVTPGANTCAGRTSCAQATDCPGQQCCFNETSKTGACRNSCGSDLVLCDSRKTTCDDGRPCRAPASLTDVQLPPHCE